jgi:uncharacterized protein (DUF1501 family)
MAGSLTRRQLLRNSAILGCSLAASPLLTPITLAAAPWDNRLVVIILRGGMDGIDVVQPYGEPALDGLRPSLKTGEAGGAHDLDGFFALHPAFSPLLGMWQAEQLGFIHAVSTPYRDKRSHFDGQDLLEAGTSELANGASRDGWLNRMLQAVPGIEAQTAFAVGREQMLVTAGAAPVSRWSPEAELALSPQAKLLLELVHQDDPLFHAASAEAVAIAEQIKLSGDLEAEGDEMMAESPMMEAVTGNGEHIEIAEFVADRLRAETRVAAFSVSGWDTHANQKNGINRGADRLSDTLLSLQARLGPVWEQTTVIAMTEFGRTARENGTKGTDHGTGGAMLFAGGAVRGGRVLGDWPGLSEADLYDGRDLLPTRDVRAYAGWAMRGLFGLEPSVLERAVFPGMEMGADPRLIL